MTLRQTFATNLRHFRTKQGLTQEKLADLAGIDRTYVSALERQIYSVSLDTIEKLAQVLHIDPEQLLSQEAHSKSDD